MVSWKGLALIAAVVAQVAAYNPNSYYGDIYAREAEAEAYYDDDIYGDIYAREAEAEADFDDEEFFLSRRTAPSTGGGHRFDPPGSHGQGIPNRQGGGGYQPNPNRINTHQQQNQQAPVRKPQRWMAAD